MRQGYRWLLATALVMWLSAAVRAANPPVPPGLERVGHIIVIYTENRSFDNLFGLFPDADGVANAGAHATQVDEQGKPYDTLPPVRLIDHAPPHDDKRFPTGLANGPFKIGLGLEEATGDLIHRFYQEQMQINDGKMNKFVAVSDAGALTMGYYDGSPLHVWGYAKEFVLADHFFHAAFGGSFLNHMWLACACTPLNPSAPPGLREKFENGVLQDGNRPYSADGHAINTIFPAKGPHPQNAKALLPPIKGQKTIGDLLSSAHVRWAWYSGGWDDALGGHPDSKFQFHHQPFAYFSQFGAELVPGASNKPGAHLKDAKQFLPAVDDGSLEAVAFYKPSGALNEHPGYSTVKAGDDEVATLVDDIRKRPIWDDTVVIITSDENGGFWDHVSPPKKDQWGPGTRVPMVVVSKFAKPHFIDHTEYDTTSILKFIESRFGLPALGDRDRNAANLLNAFDFQQH